MAELEDFEGQECVIIGTLYKHQKWKPSILHELSEDHQLTLPEPKSNYCSEKDQLFLEDEMLRIRLLVEDAEMKNYVTGIVCAILGHKEKNGNFVVSVNFLNFFKIFLHTLCIVYDKCKIILLYLIQIKEWCFPGCMPKSSLTRSKSKGKLLFLSGLDLANNSKSLSLSLLIEWICGMAGNEIVQENATCIVQIIIVGIYPFLYVFNYVRRF